MKKKKAGKILLGVVVSAIIAYIIYDFVTLKRHFTRYRSDLEDEAHTRRTSKKQARKEMIENTLNKNCERFEEAMVEAGAILRDDLDKSNIGKFGLRPIYEHNGNYFRVSTLTFDEEEMPYIVINAIDSEKFAKIGVMEEIEAYPYDIPAERIREVVSEYLETEL